MNIWNVGIIQSFLSNTHRQYVSISNHFLFRRVITSGFSQYHSLNLAFSCAKISPFFFCKSRNSWLFQLFICYFCQFVFFMVRFPDSPDFVNFPDWTWCPVECPVEPYDNGVFCCFYQKKFGHSNHRGSW